MSVTLTKNQIKNLAVLAGFHVQDVSTSTDVVEIQVLNGIYSEHGTKDVIALHTKSPEHKVQL